MFKMNFNEKGLVRIPESKTFKKNGKVKHIADATDEELVEAINKFNEEFIPKNQKLLSWSYAKFNDLLDEAENRGLEIKLKEAESIGIDTMKELWVHFKRMNHKEQIETLKMISKHLKVS